MPEAAERLPETIASDADAAKARLALERHAAGKESEALSAIIALCEEYRLADFFVQFLPLAQALPEGRAKQQAQNFGTLLANAPNAFRRERKRAEEVVNPPAAREPVQIATPESKAAAAEAAGKAAEPPPAPAEGA